MLIMGGINLSTPLSLVRGVGPRFVQKFKKLGIETVRDIVFHFPTRYEDFSRITKITDLAPHEECTINGIVEEIKMRRAWHRKMFITEAIINDGSDSIRAVWFNQTYIKNTLHEGVNANFSGKVSQSKDGEIYFSNPTYEIQREWQKETKHTARIVPIYPETKGLTSKGIRYIIQPLLSQIKFPNEIIPTNILEKEHLKEIQSAIKTVHFPDTINEAIEAKRRFAFQELFLLQIHFLLEKERSEKESAHQIETSIDFIKKMISKLPFELTVSQKKSLWEIVQDLNKTKPMNRLLQGDVGSGKTIIAALSAMLVAEKGFQTAIMAPTEILAMQHFKTIKNFFHNNEKGIALVTSNDARVFYGNGLEADIPKKNLLAEIKNGNIKTIVGTHSLIQKSVSFKSLALVVVDEQHRFGVAQRDVLIRTKNKKPHFLSMSATPIPRTLNLILFGNLDVSLISELPKNRKQIITKVVQPDKRNDAYKFIRNEVLKGRQVFVVCPRIEPGEDKEYLTQEEKQKLEVKSVKEEFDKLSKKIFPDLRVQMLHGKMPQKQKNNEITKTQVMKDFSEGKIDILVSTSVIEVGVDVPNATIMMIEGSERFGLAQLYQFRGRIGRGIHQSYCLLFTESKNKETEMRLLSVAKAKNGYELAELDLKLRGPGQFLGTEQTGIPDTAMIALQNPELVSRARKYAEDIIRTDKELKNYPLLKKELSQFTLQIHKE